VEMGSPRLKLRRTPREGPAKLVHAAIRATASEI
jgi:hypothetical protein